MLKAVTRQAARVDARVQALNAAPARRHLAPVSTAHWFDHFAAPDDVAVTVTERDFADAQRELVPSVSAGELAHYERVRAAFEGRRGDGASHGRPGAATLARRTTSTEARASAKGKGKAAVSAKGKGKAPVTGAESDDGEGDDSYDGYGEGRTNGRPSGKGKGVAGFQEQRGSDDEGMYE